MFFPSLAFSPPPRDKPAVRLPKGEVEAFAKAQRARYQRGMLKWLRDPRSLNASVPSRFCRLRARATTWTCCWRLAAPTCSPDVPRTHCRH